MTPSCCRAGGAGQARPGLRAVSTGAKRRASTRWRPPRRTWPSSRPEQRARSDAYFEGGYWLQLWGFLYGAAIAILLLATRLSARMRDLAVRVTRFAGLQTALYWLQYLLVTTVLSFPLTVYEGFFREHKYGLATQTFGPWLGRPGQGTG